MKNIRVLDEIGLLQYDTEYKCTWTSIYDQPKQKSAPFSLSIPKKKPLQPNTNFQDPFAVLPSEISLEIASQLDIPSLPAATRVCNRIF
jgi:hypothetical protein